MFNFCFSNLKYCPGVCFKSFSKKKNDLKALKRKPVVSQFLFCLFVK